jgi:hypothetical protein
VESGAHGDLEWSRPLEHNILRLLFLYCSSKILEFRDQSLQKLVCVWGGVLRT